MFTQNFSHGFALSSTEEQVELRCTDHQDQGLMESIVDLLMVNPFRYSSKALRERYSQARNDLASS